MRIIIILKIVALGLLLAQIANAQQVDFICQSKCTREGNSLSLCRSKCSYGASSSSYDLPALDEPVKMLDLNCNSKCIQDGNSWSLCKAQCSY